MAEHLTEEDVRNIATYARIGLDEQELAQMTVDLNSIIDTLEPITQYELDGVEAINNSIFLQHGRSRDSRRLGCAGILCA